MDPDAHDRRDGQDAQEEYERPDMEVIPLCCESSFLDPHSVENTDPYDPDEEGSDYWTPFGPGEGIPD